MPLPSAEYLNECFEYDKVTGDLTWKSRPVRHFHSRASFKSWDIQNPGKKIKPVPGCMRLKVTLDTRYFQAHRIIWRMVTGDDPGELFIDHKNRNPFDNSWDNLRLATDHQNIGNSSFRRSNKSGMKGVRKLNHGTLRFRAIIKMNGRQKNLGRFATADEAHAAYCEAAKVIFGEFWSDGCAVPESAHAEMMRRFEARKAAKEMFG
jgi:hypothetical protein